MRLRITLRTLLRVSGILAGLIFGLLIVWAAVAGPVTVFRILRYGDTNIDDFSHYPGRRLQASPNPFPFELDGHDFSLPVAALQTYSQEESWEAFLEGQDTIAFLVVKDDTILYEHYAQGHTASSLSQAFSMTKSFTSALIGMAIEDGILEGVDQPVVDMIPELGQQGFGRVTLHHLLTMSSGSSYQENDNPFGEHVILNFTPVLEEEILAFDMETQPGTVFRYKSGDNALLALTLDRALAGETISAYAQRRLWAPLGMAEDGIWTIDHEGDGLEKTWCCLAATARDYARFGRLYLHRGLWEGERLISPEWVDLSTQIEAIPASQWPQDFAAIGWRNYGYQWWLLAEAERDYMALGKDGQFLYVNPTRNIVIVRLGWSSGELRSSQWIGLFQEITRAASQDT